MEFIDDYGFAQGWELCNGHYLLTFPDSSTEEFKLKRDFLSYIRKMRKMIESQKAQPKKKGKKNDKKV